MPNTIGPIEGNTVTGNPDSCPDLEGSFRATGNELHLGEGCDLSGSIRFYKDDCVVHFAGRNRGRMMIALKGEKSRLDMGSGSKCNATFFVNLAEPGCSVTIGEDCLFAGVKLRPSDSHAILDADTSERLNKPETIVIRDKV